MEDVAIIGAGLHPFGHFGPKSAIDVGADAIRAALTDAGVAWKDVQFAFGGSFEVDNPDAVTSRIGPYATVRSERCYVQEAPITGSERVEAAKGVAQGWSAGGWVPTVKVPPWLSATMPVTSASVGGVHLVKSPVSGCADQRYWVSAGVACWTWMR